MTCIVNDTKSKEDRGTTTVYLRLLETKQVTVCGSWRSSQTVNHPYVLRLYNPLGGGESVSRIRNRGRAQTDDESLTLTVYVYRN